jgi:uncharacterized protein
LGISQLRVENSFINYFSQKTEIYQGMKLIDDKLGGTTPLDIVMNFSADEDDAEEVNGDVDEEMDAEMAELEALYDDEKSPASAVDTWFTDDKVDAIKQVHDYLDSLPEVGKVLSLASILRVGEDLNGGDKLDSLDIALVYKNLPTEIREDMVEPYISIEDNQARISVRILDSLPDLRRKELLERIQSHLHGEMGFEKEEVVLTGMLVLYNNMLQSLFKSQILTLGFVMLGIGLMFIVLFRSWLLAVIGLIPNLLASCLVMGIMGLAKIPMDMMTITIAAIAIGIAVDNSIHYIYRFREEFAKNGDYLQTLDICHANIGKAVFYTSITIIFGFSILSLSNFIPTILFGLLTALAMLVALLAALTLLPKLILMWRPF